MFNYIINRFRKTRILEKHGKFIPQVYTGTCWVNIGLRDGEWDTWSADGYNQYCVVNTMQEAVDRHHAYYDEKNPVIKYHSVPKPGPKFWRILKKSVTDNNK